MKASGLGAAPPSGYDMFASYSASSTMQRRTERMDREYSEQQEIIIKQKEEILQLQTLLANETYHKSRLEDTVRTLTDKLDVQHRLIASLSDINTSKGQLNTTRKSIGVKRVNENLQVQISKVRGELMSMKQFASTMNVELNKKFKDLHFMCDQLKRTVENKTLVNSTDKNKTVKEFCNEIDRLSFEMMMEVKKL